MDVSEVGGGAYHTWGGGTFFGGGGGEGSDPSGQFVEQITDY